MTGHGSRICSSESCYVWSCVNPYLSKIFSAKRSLKPLRDYVDPVSYAGKPWRKASSTYLQCLHLVPNCLMVRSWPFPSYGAISLCLYRYLNMIFINHKRVLGNNVFTWIFYEGKTREITTEKSFDVGSKRPENFANFLQVSLNSLEASWNTRHSAL